MRAISASLGLLLLFAAGCATPVPSYQRVNQASPEFKTAVAATAKQLQDSGLAAKAAEKDATKQVTADFIEAEAKRRKELVAPLVLALKTMDKREGCWAYTETTTTHLGKDSTVEIASFDPSQPVEKQWTLVSTDGKAPDDKAQAKYRQARLKEKKDAEADATKPNSGKITARLSAEPGGIVEEALNDDFEVVTADPDNTTYVFDRAKKNSLAVSLGPIRIACVLDRASGRMRRLEVALSDASALVGTLKIDHVAFRIDFTTIDPGQSPFVSKISASGHYRLLFVASGDFAMEKTFSDYRRVPCYEDRFEVKMGPLEEMDNMLPR
jgi:hypothetical protein